MHFPSTFVSCFICFVAAVPPTCVQLQCPSCNAWAHSACLGIPFSVGTQLRDTWTCLRCKVPTASLLSALPFTPAPAVSDRGFFTNIRSLSKNFDHVRYFLSSRKPIFLGLSETWLSCSISNDELSVAGYSLHRRDRGSRAGGVAFYIKDCFPVTVTSSPDYEILSIRSPMFKAFSAITVAYRPPNCDINGFLDNLSGFIATPLKLNPVIGGDLNLDPIRDNLSTSAFLSFCKGFSLSQLVRSATRVARQSSSTLDWILAGRSFSASVFPPLGSSDHCVTAISWPSKPHLIAASPPRRIFKDADWPTINNYLDSPPPAIYSGDVNLSVQCLFRFMSFLLTAFTPVKQFNFQQRIPWFSKQIKSILGKRDHAFRRHKLSPSPESWLSYCALRNQATSAIRSARTAFLSRFKDQQSFWRFYRSSSPKSCDLKSLDRESASLLANRLAATFSVPPMCGPFPEPVRPPNVPPLPAPSLNISDILAGIKNLKNNSAPGDDGLPVLALKSCASSLAPILLNIFSVSLLNGIFPDSWKNAIIIPIPKNASLTDFRPISLLTHFSKIFERLIFNHLNAHLENHNLINEKQFGFTKRKSTIDALLHFLSYLHSKLNLSRYVAAIYFDCAKAFDSVCHYQLTYKLGCLGLSPLYVKWFSSYLSDRGYRVRVSKSISNTHPIFAGVPQGSILGPLLFKIAVNDFFLVSLGDCVKSIMYADDLVIFKDFLRSILFDSLQASVDLVNDFFMSIGLLLNGKKTKVQIFCNGTPVFQGISLSLNGLPIERVQNFKYLGITLCSNLHQSVHAELLIKKCHKLLGFLFRNYSRCSPKIKTLLFHSIITSRIDYGINAYYPYCVTFHAALNRIFRSGYRFIFSRHIPDNHPWATEGFKSRSSYVGGLFVHNLLAGLKDAVDFPLSLATDRRSERSWNGRPLTVPLSRTSTFNISPQARLTRMWNSLPHPIVGSHSYTEFKSKLKLFLRLEL